MIPRSVPGQLISSGRRPQPASLASQTVLRHNVSYERLEKKRDLVGNGCKAEADVIHCGPVEVTVQTNSRAFFEVKSDVGIYRCQKSAIW